MAATPQELCTQEWNAVIKKQVESAIGSRLDGEFIAANYTAGFPYAIRQQYYNAGSLAALNTLLTENDGVPYIGNVYSALYKKVIDNLEYGISSDDQHTINQEETEQNALVGTILDLYRNSEIYDESQQYPKIKDIMDKIKKYTGTDYLHVDMREYPGLSNLCGKLSEYARKAVFTAKLQNEWDKAYDRMLAISDNMTSPTETNGGLRTGPGADDMSIGWDQLPETETLLNQLKQGNSIQFSVTADNFTEKESSFHIAGEAEVKVPYNWFFNLSVKDEVSYDFSKYAANGAKMTFTLTYNGVTTLAAIPTPLSTDNRKGWYANDILKEAAEKSGKDATGYRLHGKTFDPDRLFGKGGELRRLKTLVLSQDPIITLHFEKFNCQEMDKVFSNKAEVTFNILGGIISGKAESEYKFSDYSYNYEEQTLDVKIVPVPIGQTGSIEKQTAFVLGGVAEFFER